VYRSIFLATLNQEGFMRRSLFLVLGLFLGLVLTAPALDARQKDSKSASGKQDRIDGSIHMIDKAASMVTVRLRGKPVQREVVFNEKTAFTFRNKPATVEELKEGRRVIVVGQPNDKNQLVATRIDVRDAQ
jgi:hypothetical protein